MTYRMEILSVIIDWISAATNGFWFGVACLTVMLVARGLASFRRREHRGQKVSPEALWLCVGSAIAGFGAMLRSAYRNVSTWDSTEGVVYALWDVEYLYIAALGAILIGIGGLIATARYGMLYFGRRGWWVRVVSVLTVCVYGSAYLTP